MDKESNPISEDIRDMEWSNKRETIPTGIKQFDEIFNGGLRTGDLCFIAARPARGKTTFAIQLAESIAEQGHKVCYFSLDNLRGSLYNVV
jgi:KaiC/GvpD/RAD55 family RecA-like ATPase